MRYNFGYPMNPPRDILYPGVPTDLAVIKFSDDSVTVSFNAPIDGDISPTTYEVQYHEGIWDTRGGTAVNLSAPPNVAIDYKVRSVNETEGTRSDWSDIVTYTNVVTFTGVDTTTGQVDIAFTDATNTVYWDGTQFVQEVVVDTPISQPELITDGDFSKGDMSEWQLPDGQIAWDNQTALYTRDTTYASIIQTLSGLSIGDDYTLSFDIIETSGAGKSQLNLAECTAFTFTEPGYFDTPGTYSVVANCIAETGDIAVRSGGDYPDISRIDNISVIKVV